MTKPAIILVNPQMGENIGAAARAMLNFGLDDLRLVRPRDGWPSLEAERNAAGALALMNPVRIFETLSEAVADLHFTLATTARPRDMVKPVFDPKDAAQECRSRELSGQKTGLIFGGERAGLSNDDIALSQGIIHIPANPDFSSLNLAQAVLLMSYQYNCHSDRSAESGGIFEDPSTTLGMTRKETPAAQKDFEEFITRLESELELRHFFRSEGLKPTMQRNIRTMLGRAEFTNQELRTLHGMLSALLGKKDPRN